MANLPRLRRIQGPITDGKGNPNQQFTRFIQDFAENVETQIDGLAAAVADIASAQTDILANQAAITATNTAQDAQLDLIKRVTSWPQTNPLSASEDSSVATIVIAAHTRVYGNGDTLAVGAGSIGSLAGSTTYYIYYDDATLANATPTYLQTTTFNTAQVTAAAGRHYIGKITTPAIGSGDTPIGDPGAPPGGGIP